MSMIIMKITPQHEIFINSLFNNDFLPCIVKPDYMSSEASKTAPE